jgi:hypothetical protein
MTEFKDALEFIEKYSRVIDMPDDRQLRAWNTGGMKAFVSNHFNEIQKALRIADRLMGEPSEGMIKAAWFSQYKTVGATDEEASKLADLKYESEKHISIPAYKAMRDQLLREIEQEQHH